MSEDHVVRHGAPTLAGIKTGSLFTCPVEDRKGFLREVSRYDRQLAPRGIRLRVLRFSERGALLYLFRPERLRRDLADPAARRLLGGLGYGDLTVEGMLRTLIRRLRSRDGFPHEIGAFLGYPIEDVEGFIRNGGDHCKCVGFWKVYGDETAARRRFAAYEACTEAYCRRCALGTPLRALAVAG